MSEAELIIHDAKDIVDFKRKPLWPRRAITPAGRFLIIGLVFLSASPAQAIVNPFMLAVTLSMLWQLLGVAALLLPFYLGAASMWIRARSPAFRWGLRLAIGSAILTVVHLSVPALRGPPDVDSLGREKHQENCVPLGDHAQSLGLEPSDFLIDPRHPTQFAMYHLKGACNLDPGRLLRDEVFRSSLEKRQGRLLLVSESAWSTERLFWKLHERSSQPERWKVLEAGTLFFRLEPKSSVPFELIHTPELRGAYFGSANEVTSYRSFSSILEIGENYLLSSPDFPGDWLAMRAGPPYMGGWPMSVVGDSPFWRERRQSFLFGPKGRQATWISVQDNSEPPHWSHDVGDSGELVLAVGRIGASLEAIDGFLGRPVERAIFAVDNVMTAPVAEALALELHRRGGVVEGYITGVSVFQRQLPVQLRHPPMRDPFPGARWFLALAAVLASIALHRFFVALSWRQLKRKAGANRGGSAIGWRLAATLGPAVLGWYAVSHAVVLPSASDGLSGLHIHEAARLGLAPLSLLGLVVNALSFFSLLKHRPESRHSSTELRYWVLGGTAILALVFLPQVTGLTVFEGGLLLACVAAPLLFPLAQQRVGLWLALRMGRQKERGVRILSLEQAARLNSSGQKLKWLSMAAFHVPSVMPGLAVLTSISAFTESRKVKSLLENASRKLGKGPFIVRSSAPDEDQLLPSLSGLGNAGQYRTVTGVRAPQLADAVREVLASYEQQGVDRHQEVAVLIQEEIEPLWSGVAQRESVEKGGGILVEAARNDSSGVTAGKAGVLWGRIGRFSGEWVGSGPLPRESELSAAHWSDLFDVLEARFRRPLVVEWALAGGHLVIFQVKPSAALLEIPEERKAEARTETVSAVKNDLLLGEGSAKQGDGREAQDLRGLQKLPFPESKAGFSAEEERRPEKRREGGAVFEHKGVVRKFTYASFLEFLSHTFSLRHYRGSLTVLSREELSELGAELRSSPHDLALLSAIFEGGSQQLQIGSWSARTFARTGARPVVLDLEGRLYLNLIPRNVLAHAFFGVFLSWQKRSWRWWGRGALRRLENSIEEAHRLLLQRGSRSRGEGQVQEAEASAELPLFELVSGRIARDFFDAGLLTSALSGSSSVKVEMDPVLSAVAASEDLSELARRFPYRSLHEWSLDHPRLGERGGIELSISETQDEVAGPSPGSDGPDSKQGSAKAEAVETRDSAESKLSAGEASEASDSMASRLERLQHLRLQMVEALSNRDFFFENLAADRGSVTRAKLALARARDNLSFGVALLRLELVENEGASAGRLADKELEEPSESEETGNWPGKLSLAALEARAAGDSGPCAKGHPQPGVWASGKGPVSGRIAARLTEAGYKQDSGNPAITTEASLGGPSEHEGQKFELYVYENLSMKHLASLPDTAVVVCLGGNLLSHPAEVLRARGIPALFNAAAFDEILQEGRHVLLREDGSIELLAEEDVA